MMKIDAHRYLLLHSVTHGSRESHILVGYKSYEWVVCASSLKNRRKKERTDHLAALRSFDYGRLITVTTEDCFLYYEGQSQALGMFSIL